MGARVASGLTAQNGPQNGFGGEMMSIAPMSSASAPASTGAYISRQLPAVRLFQRLYIFV